MAKINTVRIVKTKYGTYSLHFKNPDGVRRRPSVGKDYQNAQRLAVKFSDWLIEGKDPECEMENALITERSKRISLRELYPIFIDN